MECILNLWEGTTICGTDSQDENGCLQYDKEFTCIRRAKTNVFVVLFPLKDTLYLHLTSGNLSVKALTNIVKKEHLLLDSEYMQTVLVAVPRTLYAEFQSKYETLTKMVVPRSCVKIAEDEEFGLFGVVVFKRVVDEYLAKLRDEK